MAEFNGMSYLRMYSNRAGTNELPMVNGCYEFSFPVISTNAYSPYSFCLYLKNVGSHNAYDVSVICTNDTTATIKTLNQKVHPNGVTPVRIKFPIAKNTNKTQVFKFKVHYDSI